MDSENANMTQTVMGLKGQQANQAEASEKVNATQTVMGLKGQQENQAEAFENTNTTQNAEEDSCNEASAEDIKYMKEALKQARKAIRLGEVPIGCVIVYEGKIIGRGYNRRNTDKSTLSHAEITAIKKASKYIGDWRLEGCTVYVTLEPCQMCSGALVQARIDRVVMGAMNAKAGCGGSVYNLFREPAFNHQVEVTRGVMADECSAILKEFFRDLRIRNKLTMN